MHHRSKEARISIQWRSPYLEEEPILAVDKIVIVQELSINRKTSNSSLRIGVEANLKVQAKTGEGEAEVEEAA